jgi:type I restriction enzyme S subunit
VKFGLQKGDLLACRFNGNKSFVGRLALFMDYLRIAPIYPDKLIRVRVDTRLIMPEFLRVVSNSATVRDQIDSLSATTVGNWGISATNLKTVSFAVPPLDEQRRIVAKVNELMALCDQLKGTLTLADLTRSRLLDTLIAESLAGAIFET